MTNYLAALNSLLSAMEVRFDEIHCAYPDAIQISAGGEYGEMGIWEAEAINLYNDGLADEDWMKLVDSEKKHIAAFVEILEPMTHDFILMINNMQSDLTASMILPNYGIEKNVAWVQTNGGVAIDSDNIRLFQDISANHGTDVRFLFEDTGRTPSEILSKLKEVEIDDGVGFDAVILQKDLPDSFDEALSDEIDNLNTWLKNH